ncbi:protein of unknown function DUF1002 [Alkaliphilus metalliredigens QYMF]|uniref:DUF1002 domain-containing protein n=2 Tax=Alkaliphilus TaxID=114627 RepID=A6TWK8_ALKMQ|nr:protein of unknown function DUF1002 [Alkaliphilus metalliredigens QYMF]
MIFLGGQVWGQGNQVVTLGADLKSEERTQLLDLFQVEETSVKIIEITNAEERKYLEGIATDRQIGTRAISSAYVENLGEGEGIHVETYNITWVTEEMYANAMVTAGVTDARVIAAAPFDVSGTAALTGIIKAFEEVTGQEISDEQKRIANEEMVTTGQLGDKIGREEASRLVREVKEEVVRRGTQDPEEIKRIIIEIAGNLNINLTDEQIAQMTGLMDRIADLNLNTEEIQKQLVKMGEQLGRIARNTEEVTSLLQRIIEMIRSFFQSILGFLG